MRIDYPDKRLPLPGKLRGNAKEVLVAGYEYPAELGRPPEEQLVQHPG